MEVNAEWRTIEPEVPKKLTTWAARADRAAPIAERICKLKHAPFRTNLRRLSALTHWDGLQTVSQSEEYEKALFDRQLNIAVGFTHDVIRIGSHYSGVTVPPRAAALGRQREVCLHEHIAHNG